MAISGQDNSRTFVATGTAAPVALAFKFAAAADLVVQLLADGADSVDDGDPEILNSSYSISGDGRASPPTGELIEIGLIAGRTYRVTRKTAPLQRYEPRMGIAGNAAAQENQLDDMVMATQDVRADVDDVRQRAIVVPPGESGGTLPARNDMIGKFPSVNADGDWYAALGTGADGALRAELGTGDGSLVGADDGAAGSLWTSIKGFINYLRSSAGANIVRFITPEPGAIVRTILARLLETRSVSDWGVTGDGSAADLIRINAALSECPVGWTLVFPPKVYLTNGQVTCNRGDINIRGYGAALKAKDGTSFEYVFYSDTQSRVKIHGLTFDANKAGRSAGQNVRFVGAYLRFPTDCELVNCIGQNALGYASVPGFGLGVGGGTRTYADRCYAESCGGSSGTDAADGIYFSGDFVGISNSRAKDCTDTGAVIENSNYSFIDGFFSDTCNAIAAITNVTNFDKRGNRMRGVSGKDWNSAVTGGIQIGCPSSAVTTGKLIDTRVEAITDVVTGGKGTGPAINVRKGNAASGGVDGLDIDVVVNGASTQAVLVSGLNVRVKARVRGTGAACVQFQDGSSGEVFSSTLIGGSFGVIAQGNATVRVNGNTVVGNGTQTYNYYAFNTSTISGNLGDSSGASINRIAKDGGATLSVTRQDSIVFEMNGVQVLGARMAAVPDAAAMTYVAPSGGTTVDTECRASLAQLAADVTSIRTATNTHLARSRSTGQIAP